MNVVIYDDAEKFQLRYSVSYEGWYAVGSKYYLLYKITSVGGLSPHPLSPKAVGVQNPPPQERKICVYKVAPVVEWTPANKPLLSPIILGLHSPLWLLLLAMLGSLCIYVGLFPKIWVLYGVSEILRVVAGAGSSAFAGYKLQLAEKQSRATANSTIVTFEEICIRQAAGRE